MCWYTKVVTTSALQFANTHNKNDLLYLFFLPPACYQLLFPTLYVFNIHYCFIFFCKRKIRYSICHFKNALTKKNLLLFRYYEIPKRKRKNEQLGSGNILCSTILIYCCHCYLFYNTTVSRTITFSLNGKRHEISFVTPDLLNENHIYILIQYLRLLHNFRII